MAHYWVQGCQRQQKLSDSNKNKTLPLHSYHDCAGHKTLALLKCLQDNKILNHHSIISRSFPVNLCRKREFKGNTCEFFSCLLPHWAEACQLMGVPIPVAFLRAVQRLMGQNTSAELLRALQIMSHSRKKLWKQTWTIDPFINVLTIFKSVPLMEWYGRNALIFYLLLKFLLECSWFTMLC